MMFWKKKDQTAYEETQTEKTSSRTKDWDTAIRQPKPSPRWTGGQTCTNNQIGSIKYGGTRYYKHSASYNYFSGEEHFMASLQTMRPIIEHISVVWQETSNSGEQITESAQSVLEKACKLGLVDDVIRFEPDLARQRRLNEKEKRAIGLTSARNAGASHLLSLDKDEFYRPEDFSRARKKIKDNGWCSTSGESFCHIGLPIYRAKDTTCCCFITAILPSTEIGVAEFP